MPTLPPHHRRKPSGQTLLELVAASVLLAAALVPALRLMRDGMQVGREIETAGVLNTFCISQLERHMVESAAAWTTGTATGDFAANGYPTLHYQVERSDDAADGGIADRLMAITATVWQDENDNDAWDSGELRVQYATKIAKMAGYQQSAGG